MQLHCRLHLNTVEHVFFPDICFFLFFFLAVFPSISPSQDYHQEKKPYCGSANASTWSIARINVSDIPLKAGGSARKMTEIECCEQHCKL
jgi:hypothetical protein